MLGRASEAQGGCVKASNTWLKGPKVLSLWSYLRLSMGLLVRLFWGKCVSLLGACESTPVLEF